MIGLEDMLPSLVWPPAENYILEMERPLVAFIRPLVVDCVQLYICRSVVLTQTVT